MTAAVNAATGKPDAFKFVCRGNVSALRVSRDREHGFQRIVSIDFRRS